MEFKDLIKNILQNNLLIKGIVSNQNKSSILEYKKIDLKPILLKEEFFIQWTYYVGDQVKHKNLTIYKSTEDLIDLVGNDFRQIMLYTKEVDYQILVSKKNKIKILEKPASKTLVDFSHDRKKKYILQEGIPYQFLIQLDVMTKEGKVKHQRYDKFKQLNRYLEIVEDIVDSFGEGFIRIVDFGCGKAYLTFALYHYLVDVLKRDVEIIGLDLKESVIEFGNETAEALGYEKLKFYQGDIKSFLKVDCVDMIISLHACDTATDDSLIKGIEWNAKVILAVPCCQHELFSKINSENLNGLLKYGIYKERVASVLTDALRASLLEQNGYKVDALEFVSLDHTAKNIMIRAVKTSKINNNAASEYKVLKESFNIKEFYMEKHLL